MVKQDDTLSISCKCRLLGISRGNVYYTPVNLDDKYHEIIQVIKEEHAINPSRGQRGIRDQLKLRNIEVGRDLVRRLMDHSGICTLYQKPKTTVPGKSKQHKTYPYLLKDISINRANQVWATDITYLRIGPGFMYLTSIIDWHSRKILSWKLSNTMQVDFCIECLKEAVRDYGAPEILNTDQGSQYTCKAFREKVIDEYGIRLSMDGKGRWADNIMIERFWRTIKYEEIYRRVYAGGKDARKHIGNYILLYNSHRSHSSIGRRTPDSVYFEQLPHLKERLQGTG